MNELARKIFKNEEILHYLIAFTLETTCGTEKDNMQITFR